MTTLHHRGHRGQEETFFRGGELIGVVVLSIALLAGAVQLQAARERRYPPPGTDEAAMYLQSGTAVRRLTGAYTPLAADLYWIRAIQYYGSTKRRLEGVLSPDPPPMLAAPTSNEFQLLYPMLDVATTLDPRFTIAYRFGAVFLAEAYPGGPGRPDLAIALLEKGTRVQPDKWEYMEDIGFVHYWYVHDYAAAARWFEKASTVKGAPWWLRSLAATTLAQGGDRQSSRTMWEAIRQSAEIDWLRRDAGRRLLQLRALDEMDALQRRVDAYARQSGVAPRDWNALVQTRAVAGVPLDPTGTPYELTIEDDTARVRLSQRSPLWPPPEEPRQIPRPAVGPRP